LADSTTKHHKPGPILDAITTTPDEWCREDVHAWFELSYSSYLCLPRVLMQEMDPAWQHAMVGLLEQMGKEFPEASGSYAVFKRDSDSGRFVSDPLRKYRHPDLRAIAEARGTDGD
jgi:hypothetical protein